MLEAIHAASAILAAQPSSQESERLTREATSLRQAVEGWRQSPPSRALREETMKRVLRLHVGAATLARLSSSGDPRTLASSRSEAQGEHDRPTVPPPFDIEAFARETTAPDSERRVPTEPPTQPWRARAEATPLESPESAGEASFAGIDGEVERALAPLGALPASEEPVTARRPSLSLETPARPAPKPAARNFSPSSIERAVLGAVDGPVVTQRDIKDPTTEMLDCYELGDYAGAIEMADVVLAESPDSLVAQECRAKSSSALEGIYAARLGPMTRMPIVTMGPSQIDGLGIDHRAGFLLSLVDGASTLEAILDVCGMAKLDAMRILHELVQRGAVKLR